MNDTDKTRQGDEAYSGRKPAPSPGSLTPITRKPMNERIRKLLEEMKVLEEQLAAVLHEQESRMFFQVKGKRVEFERGAREAHLRLKRNFFRWVITDRPQNFLTAPFIYGMIFPLAFADLFVSIYQAVCFPVYGIVKVRREDYIIHDRQALSYLNWFERFHCTYCAYANGLISYIGEITARTEQYFCPIKHARKVLGTHGRYAQFLEFGEASDYHARLEAFRLALGSEKP
jgi:hypothetical protein